MDQYADSLVTVPTVMQNYCYAELAASFINFLHYCLLSSVFYGAGKDNRGGLTDSPSAHHPSPHLDCRCPTSIVSPIFMPNALSIATLPIFLSWLGTGTKLCWLAYPVAWLVLLIRDIVLMLYLLLSYRDTNYCIFTLISGKPMSLTPHTLMLRWLLLKYFGVHLFEFCTDNRASSA